MASKTDKVKTWLKEYLKEYGEYSGSVADLSKLADASTYTIKKSLTELSDDGFLTFEQSREKGLTVKAIKKEKKKEEKKSKLSLQDEVLGSLLNKDITVFLISGTRLEGKLLDFDRFTITMTAPKGKSLVYKHAIATILYE